MFFGLTNSPATFQTMMDDIFEELISEGVIVMYLDDILIFTETLEEHRSVTRHVLELMERHKLYLKPEKCEFEKTTVEYLGVIISHNSVAMDPVKIAGVQEWPAPTNKKEVQSFLGFTNFYRRFIKDFSEHTWPLFDLTRNDTKWHWGQISSQRSTGSNRASCRHWSSYRRTPPDPSGSRLTAQTSLLEWSFLRSAWPTASGTLSRSSPNLYHQSNTTMRSMTRRCLQLYGPYRNGATLSKGPNTNLRSGLTVYFTLLHILQVDFVEFRWTPPELHLK